MPEGMMGVIAEEAERQPESLLRLARTKLPRATGGSIFVGAGDSYAAALAGFYASQGRCIAVDPYSLAASPRMAEGLEVFFISVSGRTASNIAAAKSVLGVARRTTAVTAVADSKLARLTTRTVTLPMTYFPRRPGVLSFSQSLLAVLKMAVGDQHCDFAQVLGDAREARKRVSMAKGTTYFLGNQMAYPAAMYAAAKAYEFLGAAAHAELLEEFSHLELFSMRGSDGVVSFSCFDPVDTGGRLRRALVRHGYRAYLVPDRGGSEFERLFHAVFVAQLAVLHEARREGIAEPRFLASRGLGVSDSMIY